MIVIRANRLHNHSVRLSLNCIISSYPTRTPPSIENSSSFIWFLCIVHLPYRYRTRSPWYPSSVGCVPRRLYSSAIIWDTAWKMTPFRRDYPTQATNQQTLRWVVAMKKKKSTSQLLYIWLVLMTATATNLITSLSIVAQALGENPQTDQMNQSKYVTASVSSFKNGPVASFVEAVAPRRTDELPSSTKNLGLHQGTLSPRHTTALVLA